MKNKTGLYIAGLVLLHWTGFAQSVPELVSYQGVLSDGAGQPITNTLVKLAVNVYDEPTGGNLAWGPQVFDAVILQQGRFNVILGPTDVDGDAISTAFSDDDRYLGVTITEPGGDMGQATEMAPRQQLLTTPYAFQSRTLAGHDWSSILVSGNDPELSQIDASQLEDGGITSDKIQAGAISSLDASDGDPINAVYVNHDGNIGIGTTSPEAKIHTYGATQDIILFKASTDGTSGWTMGAQGASRDRVIFRGFSGETGTMLLNPGMGQSSYFNAGNVGIGTTSPESSLDVNGHITFGYKPWNLSGQYTSILQAQQSEGVSEGGNSVPGNHMEIRAGIGTGLSANGEIRFVTEASTANWGNGAPHGSGSTKMVIASSGLVGIGTTSPSYTLHVHGTAYCSSGSWSGSDQRWKRNIEPLEGSLDRVTQLQGVHYSWRTDEFPSMNFEDRRQVGLIAQEVEPIVPEVVHTDEEGYKSISYEKLTAILIEAMKELNEKNEAETRVLKAEIQALKERVGL